MGWFCRHTWLKPGVNDSKRIGRRRDNGYNICMEDQWIVRILGKEYGPADLETLHEWRREGRLIAQNPARRVDDSDPAAAAPNAFGEEDVWITAAEIPELFEPIQLETFPPELARVHRSLGQILGNTFRIYGKGFFQFFYLTLLVALPSVCGQLSSSALDTSSAVNPDLRTAVAAAFTVCMFMLSLVAWPIFVAGIQILTAELAAGREARIFGLVQQVLKFWPRVAMLCLFTYGVFFLLSVFAVGIAAMIIVGANSIPLILGALTLLSIQVWMFGRFFINVLFWQQFAVLADSHAGDALRQSKELARSGTERPWYQRPMWRGIFISSLWVAFVIALNIGPEWSSISKYFHEISSSADPQAVLQTLRANAEAQGFNLTRFALWIVQTLFRPLLGIAFVLLYLDSEP
jgi:hypothetical protein